MDHNPVALSANFDILVTGFYFSDTQRQNDGILS